MKSSGDYEIDLPAVASKVKFVTVDHRLRGPGRDRNLESVCKKLYGLVASGEPSCPVELQRFERHSTWLQIMQTELVEFGDALIH